MFEKDAEEYYKEHLHYEEGRGQHYYDVSVPQAFKDGAEFGYNKAKEENQQAIEKAAEIIRELASIVREGVTCHYLVDNGSLHEATLFLKEYMK